MDNMKIYDSCREVPATAKKTIGGGKLRGFTDINPVWRINKLTEMFGAAGFGWYVDNVTRWTMKGEDSRVAAFVELNLYVKCGDEWSKPIYGIGGSMFTDIEKGNQVTSDEAFKMAYTDALSVACKALGMGADVYWENGRSKYNKTKEPDAPNEPAPKAGAHRTVCTECGSEILPRKVQGVLFTREQLINTSVEKYGKALCFDCCVKSKNGGNSNA